MDKKLEKITDEIESLVHDNGLSMAMLIESEDGALTHVCDNISLEALLLLMRDIGEILAEREKRSNFSDN